MIVAHRLLKNDIRSHEYILVTAPCCEAVGDDDSNVDFKWTQSRQAYPTIGDIQYEFATLNNQRALIPRPPAPPRFVLEKGDDNLEVVIDASLRTVYQTLVNVDKRPDWLDGVDTIDREMTSERINMRHNCVFHNMQLRPELRTDAVEIKGFGHCLRDSLSVAGRKEYARHAEAPKL
jgi:hypothetical protein